MAIARERGRALDSGGIDRGAEIRRGSPRIASARALRDPDVVAAESWSRRREIEAQTVLRESRGRVVRTRIDESAKIRRGGPLRVVGRGHRRGSGETQRDYDRERCTRDDKRSWSSAAPPRHLFASDPLAVAIVIEAVGRVIVIIVPPTRLVAEEGARQGSGTASGEVRTGGLWPGLHVSRPGHPDRKPNAATQVELAENAPHMRFGGSLSDAQADADRLVRQPLGNKACHLELTRGQSHCASRGVVAQATRARRYQRGTTGHREMSVPQTIPGGSSWSAAPSRTESAPGRAFRTSFLTKWHPRGLRPVRTGLGQGWRSEPTNRSASSSCRLGTTLP